MLILIPIPKNTHLKQFPWTTAGLIVFNILISLFTWPEAERVFMEYGFRADGPSLPNLLTHQFLHGGIMHLGFNMLYLWIVGCNIEETWGPIIFLGLFLTGGIAAALLENHLHRLVGIPLIGASGSIAAVMGAFLIRHAKKPITMLMLAPRMIRVFPVPAWVILPIWLIWEVFKGMMTMNSKYNAVAHWAHVGGFAYGALLGLAIRKGNIAAKWENAPAALSEKVEEAARLFQQGTMDQALNIYEGILKADPQHVQALSGLLRIQEYQGRTEECARTAMRLIRAAFQQGQGQTAQKVYQQWSAGLSQAALSPSEKMSLAQALESLSLWKEALTYYRSIIQESKQSPFTGKALYLAGKILKDHLAHPDEAESCFRVLMSAPFDMEWGPFAETELRELGGTPPSEVR